MKCTKSRKLIILLNSGKMETTLLVSSKLMVHRILMMFEFIGMRAVLSKKAIKRWRPGIIVPVLPRLSRFAEDSRMGDISTRKINFE